MRNFSPATPSIARSLMRGAAILEGAGIENPALDGELLLAHVMGIERTHLHAEIDCRLTYGEWEHFQWLLNRRAAREPLAYIVGKREFWSLELEVDHHVLIPRPETETLVEAAIETAAQVTGPGPRNLLEVGTGSGAVAVALALELKDWAIWATDNSPRALPLARRNANRHKVTDKIEFISGDMFKPVLEKVSYFDMVLSNPPYIATGQLPQLAPEIRDHEPISSIDGGEDGLRFHRGIIEGAPRFLRPGSHLLLEMGAGQDGAVAGLINSTGNFSRPAFKPDLAGIPRVVRARVMT